VVTLFALSNLWMGATSVDGYGSSPSEQRMSSAERGQSGSQRQARLQSRHYLNSTRR
jgi:hypothetical protein